MHHYEVLPHWFVGRPSLLPLKVLLMSLLLLSLALGLLEGQGCRSRGDVHRGGAVVGDDPMEWSGEGGKTSDNSPENL
jgi:hypothetical protein